MKRVDGGEVVAFSIVTYEFVTMNTLPMKCCQFQSSCCVFGVCCNVALLSFSASFCEYSMMDISTKV